MRPNAQGKAPLDGSQVQLPAAAVRQDLDIFQDELEQRFSYLRATNVEYRAAIEKIAPRASQGLTVQQLGIELQQTISLFIDGHAEIGGFAYPVPLLLDISGERVVGFHSDRSALLDPARPYVAALDGRPLQDWLRAAARHAPQGSPQYRRFRALRFLRNLQFMRGELGLPVRNEVTVDVVAADGRDARRLTLPVASETPRYGHWPTRGSQLLDGNVGYLRLPQMTEDVSGLIDEWMHYFKETRGANHRRAK